MQKLTPSTGEESTLAKGGETTTAGSSTLKDQRKCYYPEKLDDIERSYFERVAQEVKLAEAKHFEIVLSPDCVSFLGKDFIDELS